MHPLDNTPCFPFQAPATILHTSPMASFTIASSSAGRMPTMHSAIRNAVCRSQRRVQAPLMAPARPITAVMLSLLSATPTSMGVHGAPIIKRKTSSTASSRCAACALSCRISRAGVAIVFSKRIELHQVQQRQNPVLDLLRSKGLTNITLRSGNDGFFHMLFAAFRGNHHDGNIGGQLLRPQLPQKFEPIHHGHVDVGKNQLDALAF